MRAGAMVSTLTGAFGQALRETRLTALLGYLVALEPTHFLDMFGFRGSAQRVGLETRHEEGRSDVLVETNHGTGIVEAKVDATDPLRQSHRYPARWVVLLTHRVPAEASTRRVRYVTWEHVGRVLERLSRSRSPKSSVLSRDLLAYMKEHRMIPSRESVEIYAREINEPVTLELFLKASLYGCDYQAGSRLAEALYFLPHFGVRVSEQHAGVRAGVSYIARIESVQHAKTWREFQGVMRTVRGAVWWNRHAELLKRLHRAWSWPEHRIFLLLGEPHLVFNPPIQKQALMKGRGFLGKRFFSFEELFSAWDQPLGGRTRIASKRRRK